ncbi:uncharacterized protein LOC104906639 [Beta vulgaris subsp. vulgaris]|uniref:uncharacterized protein LOC104906639 n=1 Tax=Beta vulgaris subsp. vulgaris TaxID=3555 RepID=UPI00054017A2|nr:uncharacterized protein LOC104906639 [Beta vulgaris subsp. vulgaris]XP_048497032.1 uncharacterized protein LOC104906639 [Beta vulgaris subsp. vulgaris]
MNRAWMYGSRETSEFVDGVFEFCNAALAYRAATGTDEFYCPCVDCTNVSKVTSIESLREHIFRRGFRPNYHVWVWHGEEGVYDGGNASINVVHERGKFDVIEKDNNVENVYEDTEEGDDNYERDHIKEMMDEVDDPSSKQTRIFECMIEASQKPLYPGCTKYTKLSAVITLFNIKTKSGISDSTFTSLLQAFGDMLPDDHELPKSNDHAKELMCPFGLEYQKIHACPNDCVLYRNEYENLDECPRCGKSRYRCEGVRDKKGPPTKVLWYLPIIPRFKCMFSMKKDAKNLRWHADRRKKDGFLKHPADSSQWKAIHFVHKTFGADERNLRLGLCMDGMKPCDTLSSQHSMWPVFLVVYNLPPWLCMKRKYIMLSLLISGPKQPGNNIDVYLQPLIDDLKKMWYEGVSVYDAHADEIFTLRAMLLYTLSDFPTYGNLSGYKNEGKNACPICLDDMESKYLPTCHKHVYMRTRRLLRRDHPYRNNKKAFDGQVEEGVARRPLTAIEVYDRVKRSDRAEGVWEKESIFWSLPYWKTLQVRHCLDVMHIEKNICEAILGTLMNISGKTTDSKGVRLYLESQGLRPELWAQKRNTKKRKTTEKGSDKGKRNGKVKEKEKEEEEGLFKGIQGKGKEKVNDEDKNYLPPACYTLSRAEKRLFCESLYGIKVPSGYPSNMKRFVTLDGELKLSSMDSQDCHEMMQIFLPIAIRGILPKHVRHTITELCSFFNTICSKVLHPSQLDVLQVRVVETLCKFEVYFPPTFFDIMVHLIVHLVREIKLCGPVFLRWCHPFQRYMSSLEDKVRNPTQQEEDIIQGIVSEEVDNFVAEANVDHIGLHISRNEGRLEGKGTIGFKMISPPVKKLIEAHLFVLHHMVQVHPYLDEHMMELHDQNPGKGTRILMQLHNKTFIDWFKNRVIREMNSTDSETLKWLASGPREVVHSYEGYDVNGYTFWTDEQSQKSLSVENSGVSIEASSSHYASAKDKSPIDAKLLYYGRVQDIWELDYSGFTVCLFQCKWVDNNERYIRKDGPCGFTLVDLGQLRDSKESFVLASQVKQVFYVTDPADKKWSIVVPGKRSILGVGDVEDEEEYDAFKDTSPFTIPNFHLTDVVELETRCMRADHGEGIMVETSKEACKSQQ